MAYRDLREFVKKLEKEGELKRVRAGPVPRGFDVVQRRGIDMFRGAPVIDRNDDGG